MKTLEQQLDRLHTLKSEFKGLFIELYFESQIIRKQAELKSHYGLSILTK